MKPTIIGISQNIKQIRGIIDRVAGTEINVLVTGETGVGKELVVQSLYMKSNRVGKPFVKVNCAALPDTLLESEMFGYEKGAFTGAERRMRGKFEQANDGILFLDEIGDMSFQLQSKFLHVLQDGDFSPLGSEKSLKTNAWVISATNHELETDVINKIFREDLYYRIGAFKIHIEPLRNRPEDIPFLVEFYLKSFADQLRDQTLQAPGDRTIDKLMDYHWPGNVRELQNVLKRILILGDGDEVINELIRKSANQKDAVQSATSKKNYNNYNILNQLTHVEPSSLPSFNLKDVKKKVADRVEKEVISFVLEKTDWNRSKASRILDLSYKCLLYKIQELNIMVSSKRDNQIP